MLTTRNKIALAHMAQIPLLGVRRLLGFGPQLRACRRGINWELDIREGIDFAIFLLGAFEPSTIAAYQKFVRPGMTVLDIGANIGAHTLHLARLVGSQGRVFAFEPTDWAVAKLKANMAGNPELSKRINVQQVMLSDEETTDLPESIHASWPLASGDNVHPLLRARSMATRGAQVVTLDNLMAQIDCVQVDFIKMDVDGYECQVLGGMGEILRTNSPPILMEFSPYCLAEKGGSLERMMASLHGAGYDLYPLDGGTALPRSIPALDDLVKEGAAINVIAKVG